MIGQIYLDSVNMLSWQQGIPNYATWTLPCEVKYLVLHCCYSTEIFFIYLFLPCILNNQESYYLAGVPASISPSRTDSHQRLPHFQGFQTFIPPNQVTPASQLSSNFSTNSIRASPNWQVQQPGHILESIPLQRQSLLLTAQLTAKQPVAGPVFKRLACNNTRRELDGLLKS